MATDKTLGVIRGRFVFWEPLRPAPTLAGEGRRLRGEAEWAWREGRRGDAEQLSRRAIERLVDAFLVDRTGHADCFTEAHTLGRLVEHRFWLSTHERRRRRVLGCGLRRPRPAPAARIELRGTDRRPMLGLSRRGLRLPPRTRGAVRGSTVRSYRRTGRSAGNQPRVLPGRPKVLSHRDAALKSRDRGSLRRTIARKRDPRLLALR